MKCSKCGYENAEYASFCTECGNKLGDSEGVAAGTEQSVNENNMTSTPDAFQGGGNVGNIGDNGAGASFGGNDIGGNDNNYGANTYYPQRPDTSKKVIPIAIAVVCVLLVTYASYRYAWFPGWGDDLSNCLGKKISTVKLLHDIEWKANLNVYTAGNGTYALLLDSNNRVVGIGSLGGGSHRVGELYVGQSKEDASAKLASTYNDVLVDYDTYYLARDNSNTYVRVQYEDAKVRTLTFMLGDATDVGGTELSLGENDADYSGLLDDTISDNSTTDNSNGGNSLYDNSNDYSYDNSSIYDDDDDDYYDDDEDDDDDADFYASDYILPDSATKKLKKKDIKGLSKQQLRLARNEIYARHGRRFQDEELQRYFNGQDWYYGTIDPEDFNDEWELNATERYNANFILKYEQK